MVQGLKFFWGGCLLAVALCVSPAPAAEREAASVGVSPLQDDRRPPPVSEPQTSVPFGAGASDQTGTASSGGSSASAPSSSGSGASGSATPPPAASGVSPTGSEVQEERQQSGTVLAYLIELMRRQNRPCPSGPVSQNPPPPLVFSEPLCAAAREASAGGDVGAILAARGLRVTRWRSFSAAEVEPQDAVNRLRADYCEALMTDMTRIGAVREGGRWWVVMASFSSGASARNATSPAGGSFPPAGISSAPPVRNGQTVVPPGQGKEADALLALLNDVRVKGATCRGKALPPAGALKINAKLNQAARKHAEDMAAKNYFGTVSPTGMNLEKRAMEEQYPWRAITELIAKGPPPASAVLDLWLSSPAQCEQLMDPNLADAGIGYSKDYWTLVMGLEASGANLPPNDEPPGYANNGTLKPAAKGIIPERAVPARPGPAPQRRR